MGHLYEQITDEQRALIEASQFFFVASVAKDLSDGPVGQGPVNVSPKGGEPLVVIDASTVAYLDFPGSGDETARHAKIGGPVTVMVMSTDETNAAIVRLYGTADVCDFEASPIADRLGESRRTESRIRQVVTVRVDRTQTSCGYGVPVIGQVTKRTTAQRGRRYK